MNSLLKPPLVLVELQIAVTLTLMRLFVTVISFVTPGPAITDVLMAKTLITNILIAFISSFFVCLF
jgi:hypothetical protein